MNRGPWIIAAAIVAAAALIVGAQLYFRQQDAECRNWQAEVRSMSDITGLEPGLIATTVDEPRPDGCPFP